MVFILLHIFDPNIGNLNLFWDANGNLAQMVGCKQNMAHFHEWDEDNRLRFAIGEKFAGCYGYDGNGERTYKLTGTSSIDQVNSGYTDAHVLLDNAVLYPSPYLVVTPKTYTKHYYAGTERLATVIGMGGFADLVQPIDQLSQREEELISSFYSYYKNNDPFRYDGNLSKHTKTTDINKEQHSEIEYQCESVVLYSLDLLVQKDILFHAIAANELANEAEQEIFFSHGDHLGSAHWITDLNAAPIQYIHYAPYGELVENQTIVGYDERYKYTGKERDKESGYNYFGARFYSSPFSFWLSVDPLADKYPDISPYAYCGWNPVNNIDIDGRDWYEDKDGSIKWTTCGSQIEMTKNGINGQYLDKVYVSFDGYLDEQLGVGNNLFTEGAKLATATVYGLTPTSIESYPAFTMSSDFNTYGAIADGIYVVYNKNNRIGPLNSTFLVENGSPINCVNDINPSKINPYSSTQKNNIWIHRSNNNGDMLPFGNDGKYHPLSTGCLIIAPTRIRNGQIIQNGWNQFVNQIGNINSFTIRLRRK